MSSRSARALFLLSPSDERWEIFRRAADQAFVMRRVGSWSELRTGLQRSSKTAVCVVSPFTNPGDGDSAAFLSNDLRDLITEFPLVAFVASFPVKPDEHLATLRRLRTWGVAEVMDTLREDTPTAILYRLDQVRSLWAHRLLSRALPRTVSTRARTLLNAIADVAADGGQVPELATALKIDERTVPRWFARAGLPHARRLFAWFRLLLAAELLDKSAVSVTSIARDAGYSSAPSFNWATKAFAGLSPSELRETGAFARLSELFRRDLREARDASRSTPGEQEKGWYS